MVEQASALKSCIEYTEDNHFPMENIPFGAFHNDKVNAVHCCTRIGDFVIDLAVLEEAKLFDGALFSALTHQVFNSKNLNDFMALGKDYRIEVRQSLQAMFAAGCDKVSAEVREKAFFPADKVKMALPVFVRDYTDFYSSKNHAFNIGCMVRGPDNALQPNWHHLPVGYHGRASSIVLDGTPIRRPKGQVSADKKVPTFSDCKRMDFELEMATYLTKSNDLGHPVKVNEAKDHIFGFSLLNDWSARDVQVWEYVPLGPFTAKNFASSVSPWVITPEALAPFKSALPEQDPPVLPYLQDKDLSSYDLPLQVLIKSKDMNEPHLIATSNMKHLYFSVSQTIAHHSVTGCNMEVGDCLGTGTISGKEKHEFGSMFELCWGGKEVVKLPNGEERKWLQDGDSVILRGVCKGNGYTIGFGECEGTIIEALPDSHYQ